MSDHDVFRRDDPAPHSEPFGMTDLEDALRGPDGQTVRDRVVARLGILQDAVDAALAQGVARHHFEATQAIAAALRTARGLLRQAAG